MQVAKEQQAILYLKCFAACRDVLFILSTGASTLELTARRQVSIPVALEARQCVQASIWPGRPGSDYAGGIARL